MKNIVGDFDLKKFGPVVTDLTWEIQLSGPDAKEVVDAFDDIMHARTMDDYVSAAIRRALRWEEGRVDRAALRLGMSRSALYRHMTRLEISSCGLDKAEALAGGEAE